jgi:hypothetical protein
MAAGFNTGLQSNEYSYSRRLSPLFAQVETLCKHLVAFWFKNLALIPGP